MRSGFSGGYGNEDSGNTPRKEGTVIYCDWDGKMSSDYGMKAGVSNVVIIDKSGRIRFLTSGDVTAEEIDDLKRLLIALTRE